MIRASVVIIVATYSAIAQTGFDLELLGRVRQHVQASVAELPDYTCQETMERSIYAPTGQIEFRERLRLEVLVTASEELFGWPGSKDFAKEPLAGWIRTGAIGTGTFAAELINLFQGSAATVKYAGIETRDQQSLYRFDFHAPLLSSRSSLVVNGKSATTAYSGSFWVSRDSLDIVRLESHAVEIPPDLDCREAGDSVTYARIQLGVSERVSPSAPEPGSTTPRGLTTRLSGTTLLPSASELVLVTRDGHKSRNAVTFSGCRRYSANSSLSFNTISEPARPAEEHLQRELPAGVALAIRLERPISIRESAVGDELVARLDKAETAGGVSLAKGTPVLGRIRRLEQHLSSPALNLIGLEFFALQLSGGRVPFSARLIGPRATRDEVKTVGNRLEIVPGTPGLDIEDDGTSTGIGSFRLQGKDVFLPPGFRTSWETR
jgi:hypothetical protein